jgi:RND family efflux transporter MFP subunit
MRAAALWLLALAGCGGEHRAARTATAVRVRAVARSAAGGAMRYSATINPATRVDIAFKYAGYVQSIGAVKEGGKERPLQEGDHVGVGQELAALRGSDSRQKLAEAQAALGEALAARHQGQIEYDRSSRLVHSGAVAKAELDTAKARLDATSARTAAAKARVDEARTAVDDAQLRSPLNGVVVKRNIEVGALASPGVPAFSIADTQSVKVIFGVADVELEGLQVGSPQAITTEAHRGRRFEGSITRIAPTADARSRTFEVELTIPNPDGELKPGMIASLKLIQKAGAGTVAVLPLNAIVRSVAHPDQFAVYVVDDTSHVALREVEVGDFLGNQIPIRKGLSDGDQVVVMGASLLSDGETVQVIP